MFYCKRKKNTAGMIGAVLLGVGALAAAGYAFCRYRCKCKKGKPKKEPLHYRFQTQSFK